MDAHYLSNNSSSFVLLFTPCIKWESFLIYMMQLIIHRLKLLEFSLLVF